MSRRITRSIARKMNNPSGLERVPNELLHEIVDKFRDYEQGTILRTLMSTSTTLREFALPLFFKAIHLGKPNLFKQTVALLDNVPELYGYIRSLKIHITYADMTSFKTSSIASLSNFSHLRVFEASFVQCTQKVLDALSPRLEELEISWYGKNRAFPDIRAFTQLRVFRMTTHTRRDGRVIPRLYDQKIVALPNLTTLSICLVSHLCLSDIVNQYDLPNLQFLAFQYAFARPRAIYHFIDRHPKLREINVGFQPFGGPRMSPITMMMTGSSAWKSICVDTLDIFTDRKEPPTSVWGDALVQEMAFRRVPIDDSSSETSYSIRDLALMTEETAAWQLGGDFMNMMSLGEQDPAFRDVETLTIKAVDNWLLYDSFSVFITRLGENLKNWPKLKRLRMHVHSPIAFQSWGEFYQAPSVETIELLSEDSPLLSPHPPISAHTGAPLSIQALMDALRTLSVAIPDSFAQTLQEQVVTIAGEEFHGLPWSQVYMAPAWEILHRDTYKAAIGHLSACCPSLEEFDWYLPVQKDLFSQGPRLAWKISKDEHGARHINSHFYWRIRRPLFIAVGRELDHNLHPTCYSR